MMFQIARFISARIVHPRTDMPALRRLEVAAEQIMPRLERLAFGAQPIGKR